MDPCFTTGLLGLRRWKTGELTPLRTSDIKVMLKPKEVGNWGSQLFSLLRMLNLRKCHGSGGSSEQLLMSQVSFEGGVSTQKSSSTGNHHGSSRAAASSGFSQLLRASTWCLAVHKDGHLWQLDVFSLTELCIYMGVSKNRGTPKWMVYNGKPLLKWMTWRYHYFWKHPYIPPGS